MSTSKPCPVCSQLVAFEDLNAHCNAHINAGPDATAGLQSCSIFGQGVQAVDNDSHQLAHRLACPQATCRHLTCCFRLLARVCWTWKALAGLLADR